MMIVRANYVLAALVVAVLVLAVSLNSGRSRPHYEIMTEMKYSPAYAAFSENPIFSDRRTMQLPVSGTLARDEQPLDYAATPADAVRAGEELTNPLPQENAALSASIARGADAYRVYCAVCHGASGDGDGPVAKRGFPPPPSLSTGGSTKMKDGQLFHILTFGQRSMPKFAAQLTVQQRWDTINYIRSLQPQPAATDEAATEEIEKHIPDQTDTEESTATDEVVDEAAEDDSSQGGSP